MHPVGGAGDRTAVLLPKQPGFIPSPLGAEDDPAPHSERQTGPYAPRSATPPHADVSAGGLRRLAAAWTDRVLMTHKGV
jgi:hypothetical protein